MFPLSGACTPKMVIDIMQRPMISDISARCSCPSPFPPRFGSRKAPQRPRSLTWSWRWRLTIFHSSAGSSSKRGSRGMISRSMNARIQARSSSNSGSVSKSHAIRAPLGSCRRTS
jgi:hypothetical protein